MDKDGINLAKELACCVDNNMGAGASFPVDVLGEKWRVIVLNETNSKLLDKSFYELDNYISNYPTFVGRDEPAKELNQLRKLMSNI